MSFWDTSAIVPLCINESRSQSARRLWRLFNSMYVWRETAVEVESTFARLVREGELSPNHYILAQSHLVRLESLWTAIESNTRAIELARSFPKLYGLRALDSLQLAAALVWCNELPKGKHFVAADQKLLQAAQSAGFSVHDLS